MSVSLLTVSPEGGATIAVDFTGGPAYSDAAATVPVSLPATISTATKFYFQDPDVRLMVLVASVNSVPIVTQPLRQLLVGPQARQRITVGIEDVDLREAAGGAFGGGSPGTPREIITGVDNVIPVAYVSTDTAGDFSFIEVAAYGDTGGGEIDLKAGSGPDASHAFALIFLESFDPDASVRIQAGDGPAQIHVTNTGGVSNIGLFGVTPVPQSAAIPDATDLPTLLTAFNGLLRYLRSRGDIAP